MKPFLSRRKNIYFENGCPQELCSIVSEAVTSLAADVCRPTDRGAKAMTNACILRVGVGALERCLTSNEPGIGKIELLLGHKARSWWR